MIDLLRHMLFAFRLTLGLLLLLAGLGLTSPQPALVQAAPQSANTFTVTSAADTNLLDTVLTLREALLVARGGTGLAGLARPASAGEHAALGGCIFDGSGFITGGCGTSFADTVVFSSSLGISPTITLIAASLPAITDTAPTLIDGSINAVFPIVSAAAILTNTDALLIASNNNSLAGLTITGAPRDDLHVTGNSNQVLTGTILLKASGYGLYIDSGNLNTITSVLVGTPSAVVGACSQGNAQGGIILANGATTNTIQFATVACNTGVGVRYDGSGTTNNQILSSTVTAQSGNGVEFVNGVHNNYVRFSTITSNSLDGILISGAATHANVVGVLDFIGVTAGGIAAGNGQYGVRLSAGAHGNNIMGGNDNHSLKLFPNFISGNGLGGVRMETGATSNSVSGNTIGLNPAGTAAVPNGGPGVDVENAPNNTIGFNQPFQVIAGNLGPGVRFTNTGGGLVSFFNLIGEAGLGNGGPGVELINTTNTGVGGVVSGNAGAGIAIEGPTSTGNLIAPSSVSGNGGLPIDLGNDGPTPNGSHGPPGPNDWLPYPLVTAANGSVITGTACLSCSVLIYLATGNPAAPGGGGSYFQSATADATGHWSATLPGGLTRRDVTLQACTAPCVQGGLFTIPSASDTSELSPLYTLWLPLVRR